MSIIGDRMRELRGPSSLREMAEAIGIKLNAWSRYESGEVLPGAEIITKICRVHSCSADWLLGLNDKPPEVKSVNVVNSSANIAIGNGASVSRDCMACPLLKDHLKRFSKPKKNL